MKEKNQRLNLKKKTKQKPQPPSKPKVQPPPQQKAVKPPSQPTQILKKNWKRKCKKNNLVQVLQLWIFILKKLKKNIMMLKKWFIWVFKKKKMKFVIK